MPQRRRVDRAGVGQPASPGDFPDLGGEMLEPGWCGDLQGLLESGPLRAGVGRDQAIDSLWVLNDPALYGALVQDSGWPEDHHRRWLAAQMRAALLPGDPHHH